MDEALAKTGEWPNVAIPAGSDPEQVMREYGVKPSMHDLWSFTEPVNGGMRDGIKHRDFAQAAR